MTDVDLDKDMMIFIPYPDDERTARVLDYQRLGKQRVESWQILSPLLGIPTKKGNPSPLGSNPVAKMWRGHELRLVTYSIAICDEWIRRGYRDSMRDRFVAAADMCNPTTGGDPEWWGGIVHWTHRCVLTKKRPDLYGHVFTDANPDVPYFWPRRGDPPDRWLAAYNQTVTEMQTVAATSPVTNDEVTDAA